MTTEEALNLFYRSSVVFTDQTNQVVGMSVVGAIVMIALGYILLRKRGSGEKREMPRKYVFLSRKAKARLTKHYTDWIEGLVLAGKMKRREARAIYRDASIAYDIPELHPCPDYQAKVKARIKNERAKVREAQKPIPGDPPPQDIKPNNLPGQKEVMQERLNSFFATPVAA